MKYPTISIITPSYNQAHFLESTIKSVLNQDYPNLDYWIIDGGSSDGSINIIKKYDSRLKWLSEKDSGQAAAINKGLKRCSGEILGYLNSDDSLEPNSLFTVADFFKNHGETDFLIGRAHEINKSGHVISNYPVNPMDWSKPQPTCSIAQPAVFWRRRVYEKIGGFNEDLHYVMDYEYWLRGALAGFTFKHTNTYLGNTRYHDLTKTSTAQVHVAREMIQVQRQYYGKVHEDWLLHYWFEYLPNNHYLGLILGSLWDIVRINRKLPSRKTLRKYGYWIKKAL